MALTDTSVRTAKPKEKPYKLADERGMFLLVTPAGGKLWRLKYRMDGKERLLAIGSYPEIPLAQAREKREEARRLVANGIDPSQRKQAEKEARKQQGANTFEALAAEWLGKATRAPTYGPKLTRRLEMYVFPFIGQHPIAEVTKTDMVALLDRIEATGKAETARRIRWLCAQIFDHAVETDRAPRNPCPPAKTIAKPDSQHRAAMTDPQKVAGLLRAIDDYTGTFVTKMALQLAPLVFVRPGELRAAEWSEMNLDAAQWEIPAARMKMKQPHLVPLSTQAVAILRALHSFTGHGRYVFPSARTSTRPMSDNAILSALRRMGFAKDEMSGHGFRAMARTILDEVLQVRPDFIEHQLAHAVKDANGRAYNRTSHLAERRMMMQAWADYLDGLKAGAVVVPIKKPA
ncbi:MAG: integrase arm-type DNA-binding domain-containing protein [bacterium]|nr:integrase arm-type DNA-binding domain-containing protein [bacterium]